MQQDNDKVVQYDNPVTGIDTDKVLLVRENVLVDGVLKDVGGYISLLDLKQYATGIDIIDNLTDESADKALSAKQGKILNDLISAKASILQEDFIYATPINNANTLSSNPIRYYKDTIGVVMVKGAIQNSDGSMPCVSLISGYRPLVDNLYFSVTSSNNNTIDKARITSNGDIYITIPDGDTVYINLLFRV